MSVVMLIVLGAPVIGIASFFFRKAPSSRRCATQGCLGTLPAGIGKHCPRCGGTEFILPRRRGRRGVVIVLAALAITVAAVFSIKGARTRNLTPERRALVEARDLAVQMTIPTARDDAYAAIVRQALAQRDFEYACELGGEMTIPANKDKCLLDTVEAALTARQPAWASRASEEMVIPTNRDDARRKILDAALSK